MPQVATTNVQDIVNLTINNLGPYKATELMTVTQRHVGARKLIKQGRIKFEAGPQINFNLLTATNGSVRSVGFGAPDIVNIPDLSIKGQLDWKRTTGNWAVDEPFVYMNREPNRIIDYVKEQRMGCLVDFAEYFETNIWRVPAAADNITFFGIPYWIVKSATATTTNDGFNGTVPSGYTLVGNINPSTYAPKWSNYATGYTAVTKDDLVRKWRRASHYTDWLPPIDNKPVPDYNTGDDYGFYTNYAVFGTLVEILESQNEDLGSDLAPYDGSGGTGMGGCTFMRTPVEWVKKLDDDTDNPVYGVNWGVFKLPILSGWWMKETVVKVQPGQHTISATHLDCIFNTLCYDRRRQFVLSNGTSGSV